MKVEVYCRGIDQEKISRERFHSLLVEEMRTCSDFALKELCSARLLPGQWQHTTLYAVTSGRLLNRSQMACNLSAYLMVSPEDMEAAWASGDPRAYWKQLLRTGMDLVYRELMAFY